MSTFTLHTDGKYMTYLGHKNRFDEKATLWKHINQMNSTILNDTENNRTYVQHLLKLHGVDKVTYVTCEDLGDELGETLKWV